MIIFYLCLPYMGAKLDIHSSKAVAGCYEAAKDCLDDVRPAAPSTRIVISGNRTCIETAQNWPLGYNAIDLEAERHARLVIRVGFQEI